MQLKRWVWLIGGTVLALSLVVYSGVRTRPQTVALQTEILKARDVCETITCKGRVEETADVSVETDGELVVDEVMVSNGDTVKKGDVLFTVDKAATVATMAGNDAVSAVNTAMRDETPSCVTAPCDGVIYDLTAQSGALLGEGSPCATIGAHAPVQIRLSVPERNIARVAEGQTVQVSGVGFGKKQYTGYISEVAAQAKTETGSETIVEAVVTLDAGQADDSLKVGLSAKGVIAVSAVSNGFILPYEAVTVDDANREFVYVLQQERAEKRRFTSAAELADGYLVSEGFAEGELLILQPEKVTQDGVYVQAEESDAV